MTAPVIEELSLEGFSFQPACEFCEGGSAEWSMNCLHWNTAMYKEHKGHKFACNKCKERLLSFEKDFLKDGPFPCYNCKETITTYFVEIVKI